MPKRPREVEVDAGYGPKKTCYNCGVKRRRWARKGPWGGVGVVMTRLPNRLWCCRPCKMQLKTVGGVRSAISKQARKIREDERNEN